MSVSDEVKASLEKDRDDHAAAVKARKAAAKMRKAVIAEELRVSRALDKPDALQAAGQYLEADDLRGRPRKMDSVVVSLLKRNANRAIKALVDALDATHINGTADHGVRVDAAERVLNRLYGKPSQAITGVDGGPVVVADHGVLGLLRSLAERARPAVDTPTETVAAPVTALITDGDGGGK